MTRISILFCATLSLCSTCIRLSARDFSYADSVTFLGTESAASNLVKVVFAVHVVGNQSNANTNDDWISIGSGFFVNGTNGALLGITCNHIVEAAAKQKKELFIGIDTDAGYRRLPCRTLHAEPSSDIAILWPQRRSDVPIEVRNIVFPLTMFDDGTSLVEGRGVLITGYPLSLGTEDDKNHPVVRYGMIAQNTGKDTFLIDGMASHGNSGSPVFTLRYGGNKLAGMVTSHVADRIPLSDENGNLAAQLPYNSGLARAIRTETIRRAIDTANSKL